MLFPVFADSSFPVIPVVIACVAGVVLIALGVFLAILLRHKRYKKQAEDLYDGYKSYHTTLTVSCDKSLVRLESLGKYNGKFAEEYSEQKATYDKILNGRDKHLLQDIKNLQRELTEKNYSNAKIVLGQCRTDLSEFSQSVSSFNDTLNSILSIDSNTREGPLAVKEKTRTVSQFYEENKDELKPLKASFDKILAEAERVLSQYNLLNDQAEFDKAKALLPPLDQLLSELIGIMPQLPGFESLTHVVIPQKIDRLLKDYQKMLEDGYILSHLLVEEKVMSIREELKDIDGHLCYLEINGIKERLEAIQSSITDLLVGFDNEKKAKQNYLDNQTIIVASTYDLDKEYHLNLRRLPEYQRNFVLDKRYISQIQTLKVDIENIGLIKRDLDGCIEGNVPKQPYSIIYSKIQRIKSEIDKVRKVTQEYSEYLDSLKAKAEELFQGRAEYFLLLKKAEYDLNIKIGVPSYVESVKPRFNDLYKRIGEITDILINLPIDVSKAESLYRPFVSESDGLIAEIKAKIIECQEAEAAIVYANVYRKSNRDARPMMLVADNAFMEADFQRAKQQSLYVVHNFAADSIAQND